MTCRRLTSCLPALLFLASFPTPCIAKQESWGQSIALSEKPVKDDAIVADAKCDGEGVLWGMVDRCLAKWSDGSWHDVLLVPPPGTDGPAPSPSAQSKRAASKCRYDRCMPFLDGPDGSLLIRRTEPDEMFPSPGSPVLQIRGERARWVFPQFGSASRWGLFMDADQVPWLIAGKPDDLLIDSPKRARELLRLFDGPEPIKTLAHHLREDNAPALRLAKDGHGRFWLPYDYPSHWAWQYPLRQMLVLVPGFDPRTAQAPPPDSAAPTMLFVGEDGEGHVLPKREPVDTQYAESRVRFVRFPGNDTIWIGASDCGMLELDTTALASKKVRIDGHPRFREMTQVFPFGEGWLGLCNSPSQDEALALAAYRDGRWTIRMDPFGSSRQTSYWAQRPHLATERGVWIGGAHREGVVFVPLDGSEPIRFDWRCGVPFDAPTTINRTPEGDLLFTPVPAAKAVISEAALLDKKSGQAVAFLPCPAAGGAFQAADGSIWYPDTEKKGAIQLKRWEGGEWRAFEQRVGPYAASASEVPLAGACCDRRNRIWVVLKAPYDVTYLFTPPPPGEAGQGEWKPYDRYRDAVLKEAISADNFLFPYDRHDSKHFDILRNAKGCVAYMWEDEICYFDGTSWKTWGEDSKLDVSGLMGRVSFDSTGRLHYRHLADHWVLHDSEEWRRGAEEQVNLQTLMMSPQKPRPPSYAPNRKATSMVIDRDGTYWLQYGNEVHRVGYGLSIPVIGPDDTSPFSPNARIRDVFVSPGGDVLFISYMRMSMMALALLPPVDTRATCRTVSPGTVVIEPEAGAPGQAHTWRIDNGPWQDAVTGSVTVPNLSEGKHVFEVMALGPKFALDPTPARFEFEVKIGDDDIARWIADLASDDETTRRKAHNGLKTQPEALPLLRDALKDASSDHRWWIETTIQAIERNRGTAAQPQ